MVAGSATTDGFAVGKAFDQKIAKVGEVCRQEGIAFIPVAADTLGGWHKVAAEQIKTEAPPASDYLSLSRYLSFFSFTSQTLSDI